MVSQQSMVKTCFGVPSGKWIDHQSDQIEAGGERKVAPLAHVIVAAVQVQAKIAHSCKASPRPQARLDVSRHDAGHLCVGREFGNACKHFNPGPFVRNYRVETYHCVL